MNLFGRHAEIPHFVAGAAAVRGGNRAEAQDGAGRADDAIEPGRRNILEVRAHLVIDVLHELPLVATRERVAVDVALRQADHAQFEAFRQAQRCAGPVSDFDAPAPDIHDHGGGTCNINAVDGRQMNEPGFLGPRDDLCLNSSLPLHGGEELAAVCRFPDRAGGGGQNFFHLV